MLKKKLALILTGAMLLAALSGCASGTEETELTEDQRYAYAVVTAIEGNEITYMEVEESQVISTEEEDTQTNTEENKDTESTEESGQGNADGEAPGGNGEMPSGGEAPSGDGEMPSGGEAPSGDGEMPSGGEAPSGDGEMPSGGEAPSGDGESVDMDSTEMPSESGNTDMAGASGTVVSTQIPVGVVVHTAADTETTFSRIAVGDVLKILLETDEDGNEVIVEIWMIES